MSLVIHRILTIILAEVIKEFLTATVGAMATTVKVITASYSDLSSIRFCTHYPQTHQAEAKSAGETAITATVVRTRRVIMITHLSGVIGGTRGWYRG